MGKSWPRTEEQTAYLDGQLDALLEARQNETIKTFRDQLYEGWSKRWPEKAIVFPSWKDGDPPLTQEESDIVGKAIAKRKGQLYTYVRWRGAAKPVRTKNPRTFLARYLQRAKEGKKGTRRRTILEVYSDLYYDSKLKHIVKKELDNDPSYVLLPPNDRSGRQMAVYLKIRSDSWATESDDVKAKVQVVYDKEHHNKNSSDDEEEGDAEGDDEGDGDGVDDGADEKAIIERQQECMNQIGQIVTSFLQEASEATGWAFNVLGGGMNKEGKIKVATFSVGKTNSGSTFQHLHKNWQEGVFNPWVDFLHLRHPIEERHRRETIWAEGPRPTPANAPVNDGAAAASTLPPGPAVVVNPTVASPPPTQSMAPGPANDGIAVATPVVVNPAVASPPPTQSIAPQQTAMNPVTSEMAPQQPNPITSACAPQQTAVINQVAPPGLLPQHNTPVPAAPLQPTFANPFTNSQPLMSSASSLSPLSYAHNSNDPDLSADFLNPTFPVSHKVRSQAQLVTPELSPFMASGQMYHWPDSYINNAPVVPQLNPYHSVWGHPATSAFSSMNVYQNNPASYNYAQALPANVSDHNNPFNTSITGAHAFQAMTQVSNSTMTNPATNHLSPAVASFTSMDNFATTGLANGTAAQLVPSPVPDTVPNPMLGTATNTTPAAAEVSNGGKKTKKRKSHEEENAQLILPDGSRRRHKPRQVDENYIPSATISQKGRAAKRAKKA